MAMYPDILIFVHLIRHFVACKYVAVLAGHGGGIVLRPSNNQRIGGS